MLGTVTADPTDMSYTITASCEAPPKRVLTSCSRPEYTVQTKVSDRIATYTKSVRTKDVSKDNMSMKMSVYFKHAMSPTTTVLQITGSTINLLQKLGHIPQDLKYSLDTIRGLKDGSSQVIVIWYHISPKETLIIIIHETYHVILNIKELQRKEQTVAFIKNDSVTEVSTKDKSKFSSDGMGTTKNSIMKKHDTSQFERIKEINNFNLSVAKVLDQLPSNVDNKMAKWIEETTYDKGLPLTVNSVNQSIEEGNEFSPTILDKDEIGKHEVMLTSQNHPM